MSLINVNFNIKIAAMRFYYFQFLLLSLLLNSFSLTFSTSIRPKYEEAFQNALSHHNKFDIKLKAVKLLLEFH